MKICFQQVEKHLKPLKINSNIKFSGSDSTQSWFLPSSEVSALSAEEAEGVDSGFSDATPTAFSEDSQEIELKMASNSSNLTADEDALLEEAADLNLPKDPEMQPTSSQQNIEDPDDDLSNISGLSDLSGSNWKPSAGNEN